MNRSVWSYIVVFAGGFLFGKVTPWLFEDFARSCRTGADAARSVRRKLEEIRRRLIPVVRSLEKVTTTTSELYSRMTATDVAVHRLEIPQADLLSLRDDSLQDELELCISISMARISDGHLIILPLVIKDGDLHDPNGKAHQRLRDLLRAVELDIAACDRLIRALGDRSNVARFAWHRVFRWRPTTKITH